jgi:outer membrane protein assembly factor BamB
VEVLDGRIAEHVPAFRRGNVLVSLQVPDIVAVVDLEQEEVVWALRGEFKRQHDPRVLANGNLLLFDNLGRPEESSVIELDPLTGTTRWAYRGSATAPFFSQSCGTAQRLPNGNTLVTESDNGRVFEIDADGEIVWEFYNPEQGEAAREGPLMAMRAGDLGTAEPHRRDRP